MRVGLVARCLNTAHVRGMGRYVYQLLRHSSAEPTLQWRLFGDHVNCPMHAPADLRGEVDIFTFRGDRFQAWEQLGLPLRLRRHAVDVLHCTEGSLPWWQPAPTVVTLHDILAWQEREDTSWTRLYLDHLLPAALHNCAAIITISQSSQRDILTKWPLLAPKVNVIPHGIDDEYLSPDFPAPLSALQASLGTQPYVIYLGGPLARKRFDWAAQVLEASGQPELQLVACGFGSASHNAARAALPAPLRKRVHFAPFLSNGELLALYRGAGAVLYPTLYEGFGFPAIEAQAAGAPVIFTPTSSLAELIGPLSQIVEARNLQAWCNALAEALNMSAARRKQLGAQSRLWAQGYSWRRSFEKHVAVYRSVAAGGRH